MRLLERTDAGETRLTKYFVGDDVPPYAILSHTWGTEEEEVSFQDLKSGAAGNKPATTRSGFVETKPGAMESSAELQEAINCMFRWYSGAAKCYVYLADVSRPTCVDSPGEMGWELAFQESRWFTRGWTLQELIAPASVEFFSKEGVLMGNKSSLEHQIQAITGIPVEVLRGSLLSSFSVSQRMAWIQDRETKRQEDKAYSLFGIFDVQIPLLYGEGREKAFKRLLEEVDKASIPTAKTAKDKPLSIPTADGAAFDSRAEEYNARCHPDTRIDLLHQIQEWADDPHGACIFWLNGVAGTGKSTISRTVADRFKKQGVLGASFFFKRGERDRGNAALFFTTIAAQLVSQKPSMSHFIRTAVDSDPAIATKALREQFEKLILQPLGQVDRSSRNHTIAVVVDALDECDHDNDIKLIIHLFSQTDSYISLRILRY